MENSRLHELDGLRGVAALFVVGEHFALTSPDWYYAFRHPADWSANIPAAVKVAAYTPLHAAWAGAPAVAIFFVLSGLVLSLPWWAGRPQSYFGFAVRRIARLMPVYLVAILLSALLFAGSSGGKVAGLSEWSSHYWTSQISLNGLFRAMVFAPGDYLVLNSPLWTLVHEVRISLMLPFLLPFVVRWTWICLVLSFCASFAAKVALGRYVFGADVKSILETAAQLWLFCAGAALGGNLVEVRSAVRKLPPVVVAFTFIALLSATVAQWIAPMPSVLSYLLMTFAAIGLILIAIGREGASAMLSSPLPRFLGFVSYPLYAIHFPLLFFLLATLGESLIARPLAIAVATFLAYVIATFVEPPAMKAGRHIGRRLDSRQLNAAGS